MLKANASSISRAYSIEKICQDRVNMRFTSCAIRNGISNHREQIFRDNGQQYALETENDPLRAVPERTKLMVIRPGLEPGTQWLKADSQWFLCRLTYHI